MNLKFLFQYLKQIIFYCMIKFGNIVINLENNIVIIFLRSNF